MSEISGVLNINKPAGTTSADYLAFIKKKLNLNKVGYAGTIDKFAQGVLPILINKATKIAQWVDGATKEYIAKIKFGINTDTNDITGNIINEDKNFKLDIPEFLITLNSFIGEQMQVPPLFSAKKINGKRASDLVRKGEKVELKPEKITIFNIEVENINTETNIAELKITCSKGTFIRALARDIGEKLNTYATVVELIRTKNGIFNIQESIDKQTIENTTSVSQLKVFSMNEVLNNFKELNIISSYKKLILNGKFINKFYFHNYEDINSDGIYRIIDNNSNLIALIEYKNKKFHYLRVFK